MYVHFHFQVSLNNFHADINECAEGLSDCMSEATCVNTGGGYYCNCPTGYYGDGTQNGVGCVGKY